MNIDSFKTGRDAVALVTLNDLPRPASNEVQIAVARSSIHPSDLLMIRSYYGVRLPLAAVPGSEGVGRVIAVGEDVSHLRVGDRVLVPCMARACQDKLNVEAASLFKLPSRPTSDHLRYPLCPES
jgi:NADPH:quinone reductase-like Zn-dependent oxidoreductase